MREIEGEMRNLSRRITTVETAVSELTAIHRSLHEAVKLLPRKKSKQKPKK
jgi:hypothetical protein